MSDWNWFFSYPPGVGLAPWEIVWYAVIYLVICVAVAIYGVAGWMRRRR